MVIGIPHRQAGYDKAGIVEHLHEPGQITFAVSPFTSSSGVNGVAADMNTPRSLAMLDSPPLSDRRNRQSIPAAVGARHRLWRLTANSSHVH